MAGKPIEIDLAKVEQLAALGLSREQIASSLGISQRTLYNRQADDAEFAEAIKRGRSKGVSVVASKLMEQVKSGNITAMIFYLKTQGGWRETQRTELTGADGGPIEVKSNDQLASEMTTAQLLEVARMKIDDSPD